MIALNEIIQNREMFENKYKLMNKKVNLEKIINLEQKFIVLDRKANELRSNCNKLCGEFAQIIETNKNTSQELKKINKLNKASESFSKKSLTSIKKINLLLQKLPNPALDNNILNLSIKTKLTDFTKSDFISKIEKISTIETNNLSEKPFYNSLKKVVLKAENLPKITKLKTNKFIILSNSLSIKQIFEDLQKTLTQNAKVLILKSIQQLNKDSSKSLIAKLSDNSFITIDLLGEYVSREKSIKYYDKKLDMTQFVNMIKIQIK